MFWIFGNNQQGGHRKCVRGYLHGNRSRRSRGVNLLLSHFSHGGVTNRTFHGPLLSMTIFGWGVNPYKHPRSLSVRLTKEERAKRRLLYSFLREQPLLGGVILHAHQYHDGDRVGMDWGHKVKELLFRQKLIHISSDTNRLKQTTHTLFNTSTGHCGVLLIFLHCRAPDPSMDLSLTCREWPWLTCLGYCTVGGVQVEWWWMDWVDPRAILSTYPYQPPALPDLLTGVCYLETLRLRKLSSPNDHLWQSY